MLRFRYFIGIPLKVHYFFDVSHAWALKKDTPFRDNVGNLDMIAIRSSMKDGAYTAPYAIDFEYATIGGYSVELPFKNIPCRDQEAYIVYTKGTIGIHDDSTIDWDELNDAKEAFDDLGLPGDEVKLYFVEPVQ